MATIDEKKLIDVSSPLEESMVVEKVNQYQGLISDYADDFEALSFNIDGDDLVISGNTILGTGKTITIKGYGKANGKSKFDYLVKKNGDDLAVVGNLIADSRVVNDVDYNAEYTGMYDKKGNVISSLTTTAFNDEVDLSGFEAGTVAGKIKKGFTVKTNQGDDVITGSVLDDKITGGVGANTVNVDFTEEFGNDTYNITNAEELTVSVAGYAAANHEAQVYVNGNDVVVDKYNKTQVTFSEANVSYSKKAEVATYTSSETTVDDSAEVYDLKVVRDGETGNITEVKGYVGAGYDTLTNETLVTALKGAIGENKNEYITLVKTDDNYIVLTEGSSAPETHYEFTGADAEVGAEGKLATTELGLYLDGVWQKTKSYEVDDEATPVALKYFMTVGEESHSSVTDYTQAEGFNANAKYFVETVTTKVYDPTQTKWVDGETDTLFVVKKQDKAGTTYVETILGADGETVLAVYNLGSKAPKEELLALASDEVRFNPIKEALNSLIIKNAAKSTAEDIKITGLESTIDVLNHAFNENVKINKNKITGTALGDVVDLSEAPIGEKITGYVVNTGAGNDNITGSAGDDTITAGLAAGVGHNNINIINKVDEDPVAFGHDVINLTKGERTNVNFANAVAAEDVSVVGKDVVIKDGENGTVTFKGLAAKDLIGNGTVSVDALGDIRTKARHDVTLDDKTTKFSSAYLGADVDVAADTSKALTVDLSKTQYDNSIDLTNAEGKVTVKGGAEDDVVTAVGTGDDTFTLGTGENSIAINNASAFGNETVNLTKTESLTVNFATDVNVANYKVVKNDVVITDGNNGKITFKNFAAKDLGATVTVDGNNLATQGYETTWGVDVVATTKSFTGSRLNDVVDASDFASTVPLEKQNEKTKGVTIDAKDGVNTIAGSNFADTIKAGKNNDTVDATSGNDTYTLGAGTNTVDYTGGANIDKFNLTKEETLNLTNLDAGATFTRDGNDIVIVNGGDNQIILKNLATDKTGATVQIDGDSIWEQDFNIVAKSSKTLGTHGNDEITSELKKNTFVESYTKTLGIGNNAIESTYVKDGKLAVDTIQITTNDKTASKISAYDIDFTNSTNNVGMSFGLNSISYTGNVDDLTLIDATNTKWAFEVAATDLSKSKTNNIAWAAGNVVDSKKNDIIYGSAAANEFTYTAGKDLYMGEAGNDTYDVDLDKKTTLVVSDIAGDNVLALDTADKYIRYFNVDLEKVADYTSDLVILDQATYVDKKGNAIIKAAKTIGTDFAAGTVTVRDGVSIDVGGDESKLANFSISGGTASNTKSIEEIRDAVAGWLADNHYNSSAAVFDTNNDNKADITSLMNVYTTGTYTPAP